MNTFSWCVHKHKYYAILWEQKIIHNYSLQRIWIDSYVLTEYITHNDEFDSIVYTWESLNDFLMDVSAGMRFDMQDIPDNHYILILPNS